MATHVVTALNLNLRSAPGPGGPKLAVLEQGTEITKIANASVANWWEVDADIQGNIVRGFLNSRFVAPIGPGLFPSATAAPGTIPRADLGSSPTARRDGVGGRAFSIGEPGRPGPAANHPAGLAAGIVAVIDWLDVGDQNHLRWQPTGGVTFCNIYCYDVCNIAGVYLPRVWWKHDALTKLQAGQPVEIKYGKTVDEIRANDLYDWLVDFGGGFGWTRVFDADDLQTQTNAGKIGIICAQRVQLNKPGHIQIIAPEHGVHQAKRSAGKVTQPLQSNAGSRTFTYGFLNNNWWRGSAFRQFGFWVCRP